MRIDLTLTGLDSLINGFNQAPGIISEETYKALDQSLDMIQAEAQRRTPVDTGRLKASIGNQSRGGWRWIRGLTASLGTYVFYALYVHESKARHAVGQSHYMEDGAKAAEPAIIKFFEQAMERVAARTTKSP